MKHRAGERETAGGKVPPTAGRPEEVYPLKARLLAALVAGALALCAAGCGAAVPEEPPAPAETVQNEEALPLPEEEAPEKDPPRGTWLEDAVELTDIDWEAFQTVMSAEEYAALQEYLPVLAGQETFLWSEEEDRWPKGGAPEPYAADIETVREVLAGEDALLVLGVGPLDLDGDGTMELALYLGNRGGHNLILHQEDGAFYGTDRTIRAFNALEKNGRYSTSGGANWGDVCVMDCQGGVFTEVVLGRRRPSEDPDELDPVYYIGDEQVSREEFLQWDKENSPGSAYYTPTQK